MKTYNKETHTLECKWLITLKIDGVQAIYRDGHLPVSRANKPLYNLPDMPDGIYEAFVKDWETTVSIVRTSKKQMDFNKEDLYSLEPNIDPRLIIGSSDNGFSDKQIQNCLDNVLKLGYEGLVLNGPNGERLKVKPFISYDVPIINLIEGKGKHQGRLGSIVTPMGKVGTGLKDEIRQMIWDEANKYIGTLVEVECMSLTPNGRFRHPRFLRIREDK